MKYELPSTELIVIEENNYLKFGEYLNDMQCDDTPNKLCLDDLEYVKKLQEENKQLKDNWNKLKDYIVKEYYIHLPLEASTTSIIILINKMQEIEDGMNESNTTFRI